MPTTMPITCRMFKNSSISISLNHLAHDCALDIRAELPGNFSCLCSYSERTDFFGTVVMANINYPPEHCDLPRSYDITCSSPAGSVCLVVVRQVRYGFPRPGFSHRPGVQA